MILLMIFDPNNVLFLFFPNQSSTMGKRSRKMLADDLLKTHTISELRELVVRFENDSLSKQSELQHMVGSKYHDFIQNADLIAEMQSKSELIGNDLNKLWKLSQNVSTNVKDLLSRTMDSNYEGYIKGEAKGTLRSESSISYL